METFKETILRLSKTNIKTKGDIFKATADYLEETGKKEVVFQIERKMADYGCPLKLGEVKTMDWYPITIEMAMFFALVEVLDWGEKEIKEFGKNFAKLSFIGRVMVRYFLVSKKTFAQTPKIWRKHMSSGELEVAEIDTEKNYVIFRLKYFDLHPLYCIFLSGIFEKMGTFFPKAEGKEILCEETKCSFRGGPYHEFFIHFAD